MLRYCITIINSVPLVLLIETVRLESSKVCEISHKYIKCISEASDQSSAISIFIDTWATVHQYTIPTFKSLPLLLN